MTSTADSSEIAAAGARPLHRVPSDAPMVPAKDTSIARPTPGLYQSCHKLCERLWCVPGFGVEFLDRVYPPATPTLGSSAPRTPETPSGTPLAPHGDPVSHLWQCFRLGAPLCVLFNTYAAATHVPPISMQLEAKLSHTNTCKALVMRFVLALKERLFWDTDETFTVSNLYLSDTNGFVRVVRTVDRLLDVLEQHQLLLPPTPSRSSVDRGSGGVRDKRELVAKELLESERKYVRDMETLQGYASLLVQHETLRPDTLLRLFGNLDQLVDVQRRFLILLEENAQRPLECQQLGHIFAVMEVEFAAYESYCANYPQALQVVTDEAARLQQLSQIPAAQARNLELSYELPNYLIKPVQRICKYPLLLDQLLRYTPADAPERAELTGALTTIRRITDKVNETQRAQENLQLVAELERRVEDWKGHSLPTFGALLLSDTFMVSKNESEREFRVYLFERILLCCKDLALTQAAVPPPRGRSKGSSRLKSRSASVSVGEPHFKRDPHAPMQLKGRIFMNNIIAINVLSRAEVPQAPYTLQVWWRGEAEVESFCLKCKHEEQMRLWHAALQKLLDELRTRREQSSSAPPSVMGSGATTPTSATSSTFLAAMTPASFNSAWAAAGTLPMTPGGAAPGRHKSANAFMQLATPTTSTPSDMASARHVSAMSRVNSEDQADMARAPAMPSHGTVLSGSVLQSPATMPTRVFEEPPLALDAMPDGADRPPAPPPSGAPAQGYFDLKESMGHPPLRSRRQMSFSQTSSGTASPLIGGPALPMRSASMTVHQASALRGDPAVHDNDMPTSLLRAGGPRVPLHGFAAARGGPSPLRLDSALMNRTASDSMTGRMMASPFATPSTTMTPMFPATPQVPSVPPSEPQSPFGSELGSEWTSYFPAVATPQAPVLPAPPTLDAHAAHTATTAHAAAAAAAAHAAVSSALTQVPPPPSEQGSPPTARTHDASDLRLSHLSASTNDASSRRGSVPALLSPRGAELPVLVRRGSDCTELAVPWATAFSTLCNTVYDSMGLAPHSHTRMYHIDHDGDRVMLLDDDDLATALDYCQRHAAPLHLVLE